jgi:hypothetical protein
VRPANVVPVIHVLTEHDDQGSRNGLRAVQPFEQSIRGRTTRAADCDREIRPPKYPLRCVPKHPLSFGPSGPRFPGAPALACR